jgi:UDPglucose 6-dehydrogenase
MKAAIVGYGFVGRATAHTLSCGYVVHDPLKAMHADLEDVDAAFLCLPTPTRDGKCDAHLVLDYVEGLRVLRPRARIVIRSTIPPSVARELPKDVILWPELLRQKTADHDALHPRLIVYGAQPNDWWLSDFIAKHTHIRAAPVYAMTQEQAAVFKYAVNAYLATKVVFMHQLAKQVGPDTWESIRGALAAEGRVGASHLGAPGDHGWGFSGSCFPKDTRAMLAEYPGLSLLNFAVAANEVLRQEN